MNGRGGFAVVDRRRGGQHVGDQRRRHLVTGFGHVHFVPDPLDAVLASVACVEVVGRADELCRRRDVVVIGPGHTAVLVREIVLHPDLPQDIHSGQGAEG